MKKLHQIITSFSLCFVTSTSSALDLSETMNLAQQYDTTFQAAYANLKLALLLNLTTTTMVIHLTLTRSSLTRACSITSTKAMRLLLEH